METENAAAAAAAAFTASSQLKEAVLGRCLPAADGTIFPKATGFRARAEPGPSGGCRALGGAWLGLHLQLWGELCSGLRMQNRMNMFLWN